MADRGKKVMKLFGGLFGAAAAVIAGAYLLGKMAGEDQEDEEVTLITLDDKKIEPVKEELVEVESVAVEPRTMETAVEEEVL